MVVVVVIMHPILSNVLLTNLNTNYLKLSGGTISGDLTINKTNINFQMGETNGRNNIAIPSTNGFFSASALANDMVIRSMNNMHLLSGSGNSAITIKTNNNVGIGITNPQYKLHLTAGKTTASTAYAMKISGGAAQDTGNFGTLIGITSEDSAFCKNAIGHVRTGNYDRGDIVFDVRILRMVQVLL